MGSRSRHIAEAEQYWNGHAPALIRKFMDMDAESERLGIRMRNQNDSNALMTGAHRFREAWQRVTGRHTLTDDFHLCKAEQRTAGKLLNDLANRTVLQLAEGCDGQKAVFLDALKRKSEVSERERFYEDGLKWIVDIHKQTVSVQTGLNSVVLMGEVSAARIDKGHMLKAFNSMGEGKNAYRALVLDIRELTDYIEEGLKDQQISSYAVNMLKDELGVLCNILPSSRGPCDLAVKKARLADFENGLLQPANKLLALHKDTKNEMKKVRNDIYNVACDILENTQGLEDNPFFKEIRFFMQPDLMGDMVNKPGRNYDMQIKA